MKDIFDRWFSSSGSVAVPQNGFDDDMFLSLLNKKLCPLNFTFEEGVYRATLRNSFFRYKYEFEVKVKENVRYSFAITNFAIVLFTVVLAGAFLFRGHVSTYIFWSLVSFCVLYLANFVAVKNFLVSSLEYALREPVVEQPVLSTDISITRQTMCPACGQFLTGFENECPDCGINLIGGKAQPRQSVSNFNDYKLCYFVISR